MTTMREKLERVREACILIIVEWEVKEAIKRIRALDLAAVLGEE